MGSLLFKALQDMSPQLAITRTFAPHPSAFESQGGRASPLLKESWIEQALLSPHVADVNSSPEFFSVFPGPIGCPGRIDAVRKSAPFCGCRLAVGGVLRGS